MSVEGSHTIVVGNWLVDVNVTHYHPGNPPDMRMTQQIQAQNRSSTTMCLAQRQ